MGIEDYEPIGPSPWATALPHTAALPLPPPPPPPPPPLHHSSKRRPSRRSVMRREDTDEDYSVMSTPSAGGTRVRRRRRTLGSNDESSGTARCCALLVCLTIILVLVAVTIAALVIVFDVKVDLTTGQVMLLGDSCTGKTCLLIRFKDDTFMNNNFISTNKIVEIDKHKVKLQIYDTAGQERFRSITSSYYRDADALLLIFDVTNRSSFENIRNWLGEVREYAKETVQITLIGNKIDLNNQRKVKADEARQLAQAYNISYMETSAKSGQHVQDAFFELSRRLINSYHGVKEGGSTVIDLANPTVGGGSSFLWSATPRSWCCSQ